MTIKSGISVLLACFLVIAACTSTSGRRGGLTKAQVSALPNDVLDDYTLFSRRCSRCHTLSRPINASISSVSHWRSYVNRMRRNPSSGISPTDAKRIVLFLDYWTKNRKAILEINEESKK